MTSQPPARLRDFAENVAAPAQSDPGALRSLVHSVHSALQWREALETAANRGTVGRVVLVWD